MYDSHQSAGLVLHRKWHDSVPLQPVDGSGPQLVGPRSLRISSHDLSDHVLQEVRVAFHEPRAITGGEHGIVDYWLNSISELYQQHRPTLESPPLDEQIDRMCEHNVRLQVANLCRTKIIQRAWEREQPLSVHGWVYGLSDGRVSDLDCTIEGLNQVSQLYRVDRIEPTTPTD